VFDFRYHALSLAAVFVALLVGLLLGVVIGDEGLVSNAETDLRNNLNRDVKSARRDAAAARNDLERHVRYEEATFAPLVAERLEGRRVVLLFLDERSESLFQRVNDAVTPAGGKLTFSATVRTPVDLEAISRAAVGTQYEQLAGDPSLLDDLGRRIGIQLVQGGRLLRTLREPMLSSSSGELGPAEAVVVVRTPGERLDDPEARRRANALEAGILDGIRSARAPVVGVEETTTTPSQISWYRGRRLASVDNLDEVSGRASLVFALAGEADGAYGIKRTRDALIPDALVKAP
jgi:hypothetical protein